MPAAVLADLPPAALWLIAHGAEWVPQRVLDAVVAETEAYYHACEAETAARGGAPAPAHPDAISTAASGYMRRRRQQQEQPRAPSLASRLALLRRRVLPRRRIDVTVSLLLLAAVSGRAEAAAYFGEVSPAHPPLPAVHWCKRKIERRDVRRLADTQRQRHLHRAVLLAAAAGQAGAVTALVPHVPAAINGSCARAC
jgi:hypothetical protein